MDVKVKILLRSDAGRGFLGEGRYRLLRQIGMKGSLQKAAAQLGISYRKAWGDIRTMEEQLGFELITRQRGGSGGGASILTERAKKLLEAYTQVTTELDKMAQVQFERKLKPVLQ